MYLGKDIVFGQHALVSLDGILLQVSVAFLHSHSTQLLHLVHEALFVQITWNDDTAFNPLLDKQSFGSSLFEKKFNNSSFKSCLLL